MNCVSIVKENCVFPELVEKIVSIVKCQAKFEDYWIGKDARKTNRLITSLSVAISSVAQAMCDDTLDTVSAVMLYKALVKYDCSSLKAAWRLPKKDLPDYDSFVQKRNKGIAAWVCLQKRFDYTRLAQRFPKLMEIIKRSNDESSGIKVKETKVKESEVKETETKESKVKSTDNMLTLVQMSCNYDTQGSVVIQYNPFISLSGSQVEDRGTVFNCSQCSSGASCVCCNNLNGDRANGCKKCSCQSKIPSTVDCIAGGGNCYYKGQGQCPGTCSGSCVDASGQSASCNLNARIVDTSVVASLVVDCVTAQAYVSNPNIIGPVINEPQVCTQCDQSRILRCCKGDQTLGQTLCGQYWGPTNTLGACDTVMTNYCTSNQNDPLCACLTSQIPVPECTDKRCHGTNAMKLSNMINNPCNGNYLTCQQFFNLSPDAMNNLIQQNTLSQTCTQNNNPSDVGTGNSVTNMALWIVVGIAATLGIALVVGGLVLWLRPNASKRPAQQRVPDQRRTQQQNPAQQKLIQRPSQQKVPVRPSQPPARLPKATQRTILKQAPSPTSAQR